MDRPLQGVKVIEVSVWAYVPSAGAVLADWGAEVVKVEPPNGDPIRGLVNAGVGPMDGITFTWEIFNRMKKGIALDLRLPERGSASADTAQVSRTQWSRRWGSRSCLPQ